MKNLSLLLVLLLSSLFVLAQGVEAFAKPSIDFAVDFLPEESWDLALKTAQER